MKISVLMPSFNSGQYIAEAILSVVHQRYPETELIIMDGGSTDQTLDEIQRLKSHISHWKSEPDKGQTNAINKALALATGDVIGVLNADDAYLPGAFDHLVKMFERHPAMDWYVAGCLNFGPGDWSDVMDQVVPNQLEDWFYRWSLAHPSTFLTKRLMDEVGPFDEQWRYGMDYEYWLRLAFAGKKPTVFSRPISAFRWHETSKSFAEQDKFQPEVERLREAYLAKLPAAQAQSIRGKTKLQAAKNAVYQSLFALRRGDPEEAEAMFVEAVAKYPEVKRTRAYWTTLARIKLRKP